MLPDRHQRIEPGTYASRRHRARPDHATKKAYASDTVASLLSEPDALQMAVAITCPAARRAECSLTGSIVGHRSACFVDRQKELIP